MNANDISEWRGLTVGEILERCGVGFDDLQFNDEPTGKLRAVEFTRDDQRVELLIDYGPHLFSATRTWSADVVTNAIVCDIRFAEKTA